MKFPNYAWFASYWTSIFLYERSTPTVIWFLNIHVSDPTAKKKTSKQYKIRIKYDKKKTNVRECCVYKNLNNPKFFIVSYFFRVWKTYYKKFFREKNQLLILQIAPRTIK